MCEKMSCNGCRVLRKGCSDNCMLRQLQWLDNPQAQGHATLFVAKFFGRACLMSFISAVPERQRPALFQSLLFEAVGRKVNPVNGVVGLLRTGYWQVCQTAVETVLLGDALLLGEQPDLNASEAAHRNQLCVSTLDLDLCLTPGNHNLRTRMEAEGGGRKRRSSSEESGTSTLESDCSDGGCCSEPEGGERKILSLFV